MSRKAEWILAIAFFILSLLVACLGMIVASNGV